jgi:hypothetical protein
MCCNEMTIRVTSEAMDGDPGLTDELPASRFYRGALYGTFRGGTTETLTEPGRQEAHERLRRSGRIPCDGNVLMRATPAAACNGFNHPELGRVVLPGAESTVGYGAGVTGR